MDLRLDPVLDSDSAMMSQWYSDPEAFGEFDEASPVSVEQVRQRISDSYFDSSDRATRILRVDEGGIGFASYLRDPLDPWIALGSIIIADVPRRGQGFGQIAHLLLADWIFEGHPEIDKIELITDEQNVAERHAAQGAGWLLEGVLRSRNRLRGEYRNMAYYGLLRDEWESRR